MHLCSVLLLLLVGSAICVLVNCEEDVDRRDVHRIILKPEKNKKHKKRTKAPKTTKAPLLTYPPLTLDDFYEPTAHASSNRYSKPQRPQYVNHHDEYHDLMKPKPPHHEDATPFSYPEEELQYHETTTSNHDSYVPYLQNTDWSPIPSTQLTHNHDDYRPQNSDQRGESATKTNATHKRKQHPKKTRRTTTTRPVVIFMTSTSTTYAPPPSTSPKTSRLLTYREHFHVPLVTPVRELPSLGTRPIAKAPLHQQHHYVNYNHNNKSHIQYEVSGSARPKGVVFPAPSPLLHSSATSTRYTNSPTVASPVNQPGYHTIHLNRNSISSISNGDNSYEVFERAKDYNKQIKQTSYKNTLVPQPLYPKLQPFLPTYNFQDDEMVSPTPFYIARLALTVENSQSIINNSSDASSNNSSEEVINNKPVDISDVYEISTLPENNPNISEEPQQV